MNGKKYMLILGGIATLGLPLYFYLKRRYESEAQAEGIPLALTRQILLQIKYQMLIVTTNSAEQLSRSLMQKIPASQKEASLLMLKTNLMNICQNKEDIVLNKHGVSRDDFAAALEAHAGDGFVSGCRRDIQNMMERAFEGEYPDFAVPPEALALHSRERVRQLYKEVCEKVVVEIWKKLGQLSQEDPNFDCKNDEHYKIAVRQVDVYRLRAEFLAAEGYSEEWGCPNEIFFKVMESHKRQEQAFKTRIKAVEKTYNYLLEFVSNNPLAVQNEEAILVLMEDQIAENEEKLAREQQQLQQLQQNTADDQIGRAKYFFERGKQLQQSLRSSRARMGTARAAQAEHPGTGAEHQGAKTEREGAKAENAAEHESRNEQQSNQSKG